VKSGNESNAKLVTGGHRLTGPEFDKGYFYEPTIFDGVDNRMKIAQEEIFGPVLSVIPFKDANEVTKMANDTTFGLAAGIWTKDIGKAHALAARLHAGTVWINCYNIFDAALPFGGYKQSGWGREMGHEVLESYTETKAVCLGYPS
jgi:phenylacetaldehyde dehydrogenase